MKGKAGKISNYLQVSRAHTPYWLLHMHLHSAAINQDGVSNHVPIDCSTLELINFRAIENAANERVENNTITTPEVKGTELGWRWER